MRSLVALTLLALASACTPAARLAATNAAIDCGEPLLTQSQPAAASYIAAAGCWLSRFASDGGLEAAPAPTVELGEAVGEAAEAVAAERRDPSPAARRRTDDALEACAAMSR